MRIKGPWTSRDLRPYGFKALGVFLLAFKKRRVPFSRLLSGIISVGPLGLITCLRTAPRKLAITLINITLHKV